ncbi:MAG: hypothetical protein AB7D05_08250 [Mangrovibacterium sp.]
MQKVVIPVDRFIMSKGHSVEGYYAVLSRRGFIPDSLLDSYGKFKSVLAGHHVASVTNIFIISGGKDDFLYKNVTEYRAKLYSM